MFSIENVGRYHQYIPKSDDGKFRGLAQGGLGIKCGKHHKRNSNEHRGNDGFIAVSPISWNDGNEAAKNDETGQHRMRGIVLNQVMNAYH
jgi:hypothetical protein